MRTPIPPSSPSAVLLISSKMDGANPTFGSPPPLCYAALRLSHSSGPCVGVGIESEPDILKTRPETGACLAQRIRERITAWALGGTIDIFERFSIKVSILAVVRPLEQNQSLGQAFSGRGRNGYCHGASHQSLAANGHAVTAAQQNLGGRFPNLGQRLSCPLLSSGGLRRRSRKAAARSASLADLLRSCLPDIRDGALVSASQRASQPLGRRGQIER